MKDVLLSNCKISLMISPATPSPKLSACWPFPFSPSLDAKAGLPALVSTSPAPGLAEKPKCSEATRQRPLSVSAREKSRRWGERVFLSSFRHQVHPLPEAVGGRSQAGGNDAAVLAVADFCHLRSLRNPFQTMLFYASGSCLKPNVCALIGPIKRHIWPSSFRILSPLSF